jgi:hypothetical protein
VDAPPPHSESPALMTFFSPRLVLLASLLVGVGCSSAGTTPAQCSSGFDCASGVCSATGSCEPVTAGGGGAAGAGGDAGEGGAAGDGAAGEAGAAGQGGGGPGPGGAGGAGGGAITCSPDHDGTITRAETPLGLGLHATYKFAEGVPVGSAGMAGPDGQTVWDFSGPLPGDHDVLVETRNMAGTWYEKKFAGGTYALRLSDTAELLGIFQVTDTSLNLLGVVSPADGLTRTELNYAPPVNVVAFPLKKGATWSTKSTVTGLLSGVFSTYTEQYDSKVDADGLLKVPFGDFPALRVNVKMTRTVGLLVTTRRTFFWESECFGQIAQLVSKDNDNAIELTSVSEIFRLTP